MQIKKFVPCIYLNGGEAVRSLSDNTRLSEHPLDLAKHYIDKNADELIIFQTDSMSYEANIPVVEQIVKFSSVPVLFGGELRLNDTWDFLNKKLCPVIINLETINGTPAQILEMAGDYEKSYLYAAFKSVVVLDLYRNILTSSFQGLMVSDVHVLTEENFSAPLPYYVHVERSSLNKLLDIFALEDVCGITGNTINDNVKEILALKKLCQQQGLPIKTLPAAFPWSAFKLNSDGMVPVIVTDYENDQVLMLAYMNQEAYETTLRCGKMTYYSRSRNELWLKGDTSGHYQYVKSLSADCDMDTILAKVSQVGAACHTGERSCFFNHIYQSEEMIGKIDRLPDTYNPPADASSNEAEVTKAETTAKEASDFELVYQTICDKKNNPEKGSYAGYLFDSGLDKILKQINCETIDVLLSAKNNSSSELPGELGDLLYHMMVLMAQKNISMEELLSNLKGKNN